MRNTTHFISLPLDDAAALHPAPHDAAAALTKGTPDTAPAALPAEVEAIPHGILPRPSQATLLELLLEADPHPHGIDPLVHPTTGHRQIPLHLIQADFHLTPPLKPMGHIPEEVLQEMVAFEENRLFPVFAFYPRLSAKEVVVSAVKCVAFDPKLVERGMEALSLGMEALVWFMRNRGSMKDRAFHREDVYSIFVDPRSTAFSRRTGEMRPWDNVALTVFRQASPYLGTPWIGVTMIVYEGEGDDIKIWTQKRGRNCASPSMLDTTAGGAVESGRMAWQGMINESEEEAGISGAMVRRYARFEGALNFYLDPNTVPKPLVHLCFDLKRPEPTSADFAATQPKVTDDEVESFVLLSIPEILQAVQQRQFAPSAIPDLIFFLIRKGFVSRDTEPEFEEIVKRFQRPWDVAFPHRILDF